MKQYRITSEHFVPQGETGDADAVMDAKDLYELKKLAGMLVFEEEGPGDAGTGGVVQPGNNVPNVGDSYTQSPVGSNITDTAKYRNELLQKYNVKPGDELWFLINFEPVRGLGANSGTLEQKIQQYFKQHPEKLPENLPKLPGEDS
jgi:hypothetical protein